MPVKTVLITGASRGLGLALAQAFLARGDSVIFVARKFESGLTKIQPSLGLPVIAKRATGSRNAFVDPDECCALSGRPLLLSCDLTDPKELQALLAHPALKKVDVLINNAGMQGPIGPCHENDWQAWQQTLQLNFLVPVQLCRALIPHFIQRGSGKIINVSGGGATGSRPYFSAYSSAKTALVRFTEVLADELKPFGISVNAIAPGAMPTQMVEEALSQANKFSEKERSTLEEAVKTGGQVMQKAVDLALYLASDDCPFVTGKLISARWDPWENFAAHQEELASTDIYTLRRIVPKERAMNWGDQ